MGTSCERTRRMVEMYGQGATLQEIGDAYGVTRQRVKQLLSPHLHKTAERCIYPGLRAWMMRNLSPRELHEAAGIDCGIAAFYGKLKGRTQLTMREIKAIMDCTGETFDYLFEEEDT